MNNKFFIRVLWLLIPLLTLFNLSAWGGDLTVTLDFEGSSGSWPYNSDWECDASSNATNHTDGGSRSAGMSINGSQYITYKNALTNIKCVTFYINRTSSNTAQPTIVIQKSTWNGSAWSDWTDITGTSQTFTIARNTWTLKTFDFESYKYNGKVRIKYTNSTTAIKMIDDIVITYESSCTSLDMSAVTATPGDRQIELSWPTVSNADSYTVTCKVKSTGVAAGTVGGVTGSGPKTCTITGLTNGTEYTWSVMPVGSGSYCADNTPATGDATPNVYYTVTWNNHGSTSTSSVASGSKPTFPATPSSCDLTCTTFYGWSTSAWSGSITSLAGKTIYTKASDMPDVSGDVTYYAVYSDGLTTEYTFTSSSWNATSGGSDANWTSGKAGAGYTAGQGVQVTTTYTGANATSPISFSNVNKVVVTYNTNKTAGVGSIGIKIGSNSEVTNAVAYDSGISDDGRSANFTTEYTFSPVQSGTIKLTANTTTNSIWPKSIAIYSGAATPHYLTTCCTPLASINGSFNLTPLNPHKTFCISTI